VTKKIEKVAAADRERGKRSTVVRPTMQFQLPTIQSGGLKKGGRRDPGIKNQQDPNNPMGRGMVRWR